MGHGRCLFVMAGPSDRACGPPRGMLVPAIHVFAAISTASRGWPARSGHDVEATTAPALRCVVVIDLALIDRNVRPSIHGRKLGLSRASGFKTMRAGTVMRRLPAIHPPPS